MAAENTGFMKGLLEEYKNSGGQIVPAKDSSGNDTKGIPIDLLGNFMADQAILFDKYVHETLNKKDGDTISLSNFPNGKVTLSDKSVVDVKTYFGDKASISVGELKKFQTPQFKEQMRGVWNVIDSSGMNGKSADGIITADDFNRIAVSAPEIRNGTLDTLKQNAGDAVKFLMPARWLISELLDEIPKDFEHAADASKPRGNVAEFLGTKLGLDKVAEKVVDGGFKAANSLSDMWDKDKGTLGILAGGILAIFGLFSGMGMAAFLIPIFLGGVGLFMDEKSKGRGGVSSLASPVAGSPNTVTVDGIMLNGQVLANGKFQTSSIAIPDVELGEKRNVPVDMQLAVTGGAVSANDEQRKSLQELVTQATSAVDVQRAAYYRENPPLTMTNKQVGKDGVENYSFELGMVADGKAQNVIVTARKNANDDLEVTSAAGVQNFQPFTVPIGIFGASIPENCKTVNGSDLAQALTANLQSQLPVSPVLPVVQTVTPTEEAPQITKPSFTPEIQEQAKAAVANGCIIDSSGSKTCPAEAAPKMPNLNRDCSNDYGRTFVSCNAR